MANQKLMTPLDYVAFLLGAPPPPREPDVQVQPVPTPVYMPNPRTIDERMLDFGGGFGGPQVPPPIAPPAPPGFTGY